MHQTNLESTQYRRTVVLDIETVSLDPNLAKGALDALTGRVVCVGMLIDDGARLVELAIASEDEVQILTEFWGAIQSTDVLVGFNLIEFDLAFLKQRSWICNVRPSRSLDLRRFYSTHVDVMQLWSNWSFRKFVSLDALSTALNCGQKSAHGKDVAAMWAAGDLESIKECCLEDVRITDRIYRKMMYLQPRFRKLQPKPEAAALPVEAQNAPPSPNRRRGRRGSTSWPIRTSA